MPEIVQPPAIEVLSLESVEQLSEKIQPLSKFFTLLLAWDAPTVDQVRLREWLRPLVDHGLVYFCAWGKECEAVHEAVDFCGVGRNKDWGNANDFMMTTWHDDESLEEACWFFDMLAVPTEAPFASDLQRFAVAIGNPEWAQTMSRAFLERS